jgi:EAL domain-containing protein (putative c-di-GMP-specific phosphodiesterase class I)
VQRKSQRASALWQRTHKHLRDTINQHPAHICREGYDDWLLEEIAVCGIKPARVTLEITESALLVDEPAVALRLGRLRDAGLTIAIDDFGTGYASLAYLMTLPFDMLKIDRGLVAGIVDRERDRIVVKAMIRLARELDLTVVVEGVESTPQLALLAEWGCDLYQGFLGAGPLTHEELTRFVAAAHAEAA